MEHAENRNELEEICLSERVIGLFNSAFRNQNAIYSKGGAPQKPTATFWYNLITGEPMAVGKEYPDKHSDYVAPAGLYLDELGPMPMVLQEENASPALLELNKYIQAYRSHKHKQQKGTFFDSLIQRLLEL
jgi:hypothetical protein